MKREVGPVDKEIGARIRSLRLARGLSQYELAAKLGIPRTTAAERERGERRVWSGDLIQLASALDTTPHYLLGWMAEPPRTDACWAPHPDSDAIWCVRLTGHPGNHNSLTQRWK
jgi:transcriptional regulator with XRE-family HTH domain